jgi:hypothetical protein
VREGHAFRQVFSGGSAAVAVERVKKKLTYAGSFLADDLYPCRIAN